MEYTKNRLPINQRRCMSGKEAADYMGVGIQKARLLCREIGAEIRIGGRLLYDRPIIDAWLDNQRPGRTDEAV